MIKKQEKERECQIEYQLPDYMGDIKKLLYAGLSATPSGGYITEGGYKTLGSCGFDVIYLDSENNLTAFHQDGDYEMDFPGIDEDCQVVESITWGHSAVRITGPRKMTLKGVVSCAILVTDNKSETVEGNLFEGDKEPEVMTRVIKERYFITAERVSLEYGCLLESLSDVKADEIEIIYKSQSITCLEARTAEGGITVKGEVLVAALVKTAAGEILSLKKSIPFEKKIECENVTQDLFPFATASVISNDITALDDNGGCEISARLIIEINSAAIGNREKDMILDGYLIDHTCDVKYKTYEYAQVLGVEEWEIPLTVRTAREDGVAKDLSRIIASSVSVRELFAEVENGGVKLGGEAVFSGVACEINADNTVSYVPIKATGKIDENLKSSLEIPSDAIIELSYHATGDFIIDGDSLVAKGVLSVSAIISSTHRIRVMASATASECCAKAASPKITVYYPLPDERLFDIARRHNTTVARILEDNGGAMPCAADGYVCEGVKKLIIM